MNGPCSFPPPLSDHIPVDVLVSYQTLSISTLTTAPSPPTTHPPPNPWCLGVLPNIINEHNSHFPPQFLTLRLFIHMGYYTPTLLWPWLTWHSQCTHGSLSPLHEVPSSYHRSTSRSWQAKNKRNIIHVWDLQEVIPILTEIKYLYTVLFKFFKTWINILCNFKMSSMSKFSTLIGIEHPIKVSYLDR